MAASELTRGERNCKWIEEYCRVPEGALVGQPVRLRDWQRKEICRIYDNPSGTRRAIISFGRKNGKGLALDTPIPTPCGWRTIADIKPGCVVFGSDGSPTRVLMVSDTHTGLRCWRLTFSDGSTIVADEQHRWLTTHRYRPWAKARRNGSGHGGRKRTEVVTTPQIASSVAIARADGLIEHNHKIAVAGPCINSPISLPIDPYVIGAWLGDGTSTCSAFTSGEEDLPHFECELSAALGAVKVTRHAARAATIRATGTGLQKQLRGIGLLGNKHIPSIYFDAGTEQRWALLQGLMDTDGTVTRCAGRTTARASFTATRSVLAYGVWRLARSLGLKATVRRTAAFVRDKRCRDAFQVSFSASADEPVFRLRRKQVLLPEKLGKRSRTLTITACEEVESVPTRCLMVEAEDSLFLAGHGCVPTHNTSISAFLLLLHLCGHEAKPNSQLYSAAQSREQAAILFALAAKIIRLSPDLSQYVVVRDTAKQLYCPELGTLYRALSAEASTAYGLSPVFTVHDELGQVKGPRSELYEALETASGAQAEPLSIVISTQAPNDGDLLSMLIDDALRGSDPRTVVSLYSADESLDPFSDDAIRAANPAFGDFLNAVEVREQAAVASRMPSREAAYRNLILNQRVNASNPLIPKGIWTAARADYALSDFYGEACWAGLDLSATTDTTALVLVFQRDGAFFCWPFFWLPEIGLRDKADKDRVPYDVWRDQGHLLTTPGKAIDQMAVVRKAVEIMADFDVRIIAYDRWGMKFLQPQLEREGIDLPLEEFGQGYQSMSPAISTLESSLLNGTLFHPGNPVLTFHAANAVATSDPAGNRKLDKQKATGRIDGMVALCMALAKASAEQPEQSIYNTRDLIIL